MGLFPSLQPKVEGWDISIFVAWCFILNLLSTFFYDANLFFVFVLSAKDFFFDQEKLINFPIFFLKMPTTTSGCPYETAWFWSCRWLEGTTRWLGACWRPWCGTIRATCVQKKTTGLFHRYANRIKFVTLRLLLNFGYFYHSEQNENCISSWLITHHIVLLTFS